MSFTQGDATSERLAPQAIAPDTAERPIDRATVSAILASLFGWSLDLFDLFILLYVAPVVGELFFPSSQPTLSLALVYASFAVTLLMRPIGSALFGNYADAHGRKGAMTVAVIGVGVATAAFGLLPTIHQAGILAPILFIALRLVQGVFVGGVVASTHTIGTESVPARWRGLMSGLIGGGGAGFGALLASLVFYVTSTLFPGEAYAVWGWRCMFFAGLLSSILGFLVMSGMEESPFFKALQKAKAERKAEQKGEAARSPIAALFASDYRNVLLVNLLVTFGGGAGYYLTSGYLPAFFKVVNGLSNTASSLILIAGSVVAIIAAVGVGALSQGIGRKKAFLLVGIVAIVALPWLYLQLAAARDVSHITLYAMAIVFLGNAAYAPVLIFLNERFPTAFRATGTGLSWNIGFALGGMMPTVVTFASKTPADIPPVLAIFCGAVFAVYLLGGLIVPETKGEFR